jgi:hypothetical protein
MKMVLVFDTDDMTGMKSCLKIFKQLAKDRGLDNYMANADDPKFGRVEFIKMLKDFEAFTDIRPRAIATDGTEYISLKDYKEFSDYVFRLKRSEGYYTPKWKAPR